MIWKKCGHIVSPQHREGEWSRLPKEMKMNQPPLFSDGYFSMKKGVWRSKIPWLFLIDYELLENQKEFFYPALLGINSLKSTSPKYSKIFVATLDLARVNFVSRCRADSDIDLFLRSSILASILALGLGMAGNSFSRCLKEFFHVPSDVLGFLSRFSRGTVGWGLSLFILTVQDTGLSMFFFVWVLATVLVWVFAAEWTGHVVFRLTGICMGTWDMSDTIMESIILTILAICWVGPIMGVMEEVIGAIMNGSVKISLNTVLKKVMVIVVGTDIDSRIYFRW